MNVGPAVSSRRALQRFFARADFVTSKTSISRRSGTDSAAPFKGSRPDRLVFMLSTLSTSQAAKRGPHAQIRVVVVMRNALGSDTLWRPAACQRKYVSCTASSASAMDEHTVCKTEQVPAVRLEARPDSTLRSWRSRHSTQLQDGTATAGQSQPAEGQGDQPS